MQWLRLMSILGLWFRCICCRFPLYVSWGSCFVVQFICVLFCNYHALPWRYGCFTIITFIMSCGWPVSLPRGAVGWHCLIVLTCFFSVRAVKVLTRALAINKCDTYRNLLHLFKDWIPLNGVLWKIMKTQMKYDIM